MGEMQKEGLLFFPSLAIRILPFLQLPKSVTLQLLLIPCFFFLLPAFLLSAPPTLVS